VNLSRNQVLADAEMLKRTLRLRSPTLVSRHLTTPKLSGSSSKFGLGIARSNCDTLIGVKNDGSKLGAGFAVMSEIDIPADLVLFFDGWEIPMIPMPR